MKFSVHSHLTFWEKCFIQQEKLGKWVVETQMRSDFVSLRKVEKLRSEKKRGFAGDFATKDDSNRARLPALFLFSIR
jgi:hypothetical protein